MKRLNKNTTIILTSMLLAGIGGTIFRFSILFYLYLLSGSFSVVGYLGGIVMISTQFASYIGAYIGDKQRRDRVIWFSTILVILGTGTLVMMPTITGILVGQLIAQTGNSIRGPVRDALLADSIPKGSENNVYSTLYSIELIGITLGNLLGYFLFSVFSSDRSVNYIILVVRISFVILSGSEVLHFFLRDIPETTNTRKGTINRKHETGNWKVVKSILLVNFIFGFGAGILMPFLPLFYFTVYHISMAKLSGIFALANVVSAVWTKKLSSAFKQYSREKVIWVSYIISTGFLFIVAFYPPFIFVLLLTIARSTILSATYPLTESLLMQNTERNLRSRVNMYQNLAWTLLMGIGQILGGLLINLLGFSFVIALTALIYLIASIIFKITLS